MTIRSLRVVSMMVMAVFVVALLPAAALADQSYPDPPGDGAGAPDVTAVDVSNDNEGNLTIRVKVSGVPAVAPKPLGESASTLFIAFDTDRDGSTGSGEGADVAAFFDFSVPEWGLGRWTGSAFDYANQEDTASASPEPDGIVLTINKRDLNGTSSFDFWLYGDLYDGDERVATDTAPDGTAVWTYTLVTKQVALRATKPKGRPTFPVAGKRFVIATVVSRASDNVYLPEGKTTCVVRLGGQLVKAVASFQTGVARCAVSLPKRAVGKRLTGSIGVSVPGGQTSRAFSFRVL